MKLIAHTFNDTVFDVQLEESGGTRILRGKLKQESVERKSMFGGLEPTHTFNADDFYVIVEAKRKWFLIQGIDGQLALEPIRYDTLVAIRLNSIVTPISKADKRIERLFPKFWKKLQPSLAKQIIAKLDVRAPKPKLRGRKPILKRLSNDKQRRMVSSPAKMFRR